MGAIERKILDLCYIVHHSTWDQRRAEEGCKYTFFGDHFTTITKLLHPPYKGLHNPDTQYKTANSVKLKKSHTP